jgi:hypothetical protein
MDKRRNNHYRTVVDKPSPSPMPTMEELREQFKGKVSINADRDYITHVFHDYWKVHRIKEPTKYFSLREAIHRLQQATKITPAELSAYLRLSTNRLNSIAANNGPLVQQQYEILIQLAKSYSLPVLVGYLETLLAYSTATDAPKRGRKPKDRFGANDSTPGWVSMMGE